MFVLDSIAFLGFQYSFIANHFLLVNDMNHVYVKSVEFETYLENMLI